MLLGSEGLAGHRDDVRFVQQAGSQFHGGLRSRLAEIGAHVGIDVEGALRLGAGDAGDLRQAAEDAVAQSKVVGAHLGRRTPASR